MNDKSKLVGSKILAKLSDGMPHSLKELHSCCGPSSASTVYYHLSILRTRLRPNGEDIICEYVMPSRGYAYRHVRLLANPYR